jgi:hypothetical protein
MGEVLRALNALKNHAIDFDDTFARQLIDCIKVVYKTELLIIFKSGIEKTVTMEN